MKIIGDVKVIEYNPVTEKVTVGLETDRGFRREYFTIDALTKVIEDENELTDDGLAIVKKIRDQGGVPWVNAQIEKIQKDRLAGKYF